MITRKVALYGAGSDLHNIFPMLYKNNYEPVCIADGNPEKQGSEINGIPVVSPESLRGYSFDYIIITASFFDDIFNRIMQLMSEESDLTEMVLVAPYTWLMLVNVDYNEKLLLDAFSYIKKYENDIFSLYDLKDERTNKLLSFIISSRKERSYQFKKYNEMKGFQFVEGYFYEGELNDIDDFTFIDCGAYIGDTYFEIRDKYDSKMKKYIGYEPSKHNFEMLNNNIGEIDSVTLVNAALGEYKHQEKWGKAGASFGVVNIDYEGDNEVVSIVPLDGEEIDVIGKLVIKMDVEGSELSILKGSVDTIRKYHPYMAVCIYHKFEDIYELPKFIHNLGLKYRFILKSGVHTHLLAIPE